MVATVCVFEGDGAAPEAVHPTVRLLRGLDVPVEFLCPPVDEEYASELDTGQLPDAIADGIRDADAVLFGASSGRHGPILQFLRREYGGGTFANVRPVKFFPGTNSPLADPSGIDYVLIRENLQGLYVGVDGETSDLRGSLDGTGIDPRDRLAAADPGRFDVRAYGESAIHRFASFAVDYAESFGGSDEDVRLTCVSKSNVLSATDGLFDDIVAATAEDRDIRYEHLHADDAAQQLVLNPSRFDVVVTPNFAGDVLSELGAGTIGGLGLAPSGCFGEGRAYFEPVHGTAPDIAGDESINPTATLLSSAMLFDYLGFDGTAEELREAVMAVYASGETLPPDQGGTASTGAFVDAVAEFL